MNIYWISQEETSLPKMPQTLSRPVSDDIKASISIISN